jgi:G:T-mismatch repair DNA endonuclease (very short patch repair protein)
MHLKRKKHTVNIGYDEYMKSEYGVDVSHVTPCNRNISFPIFCALCGNAIKNLTGLARHLKMSHGGYSYSSYVKDFLGVDVVPRQDETNVCQICHRSFLNLAVHLCKKHGITKDEYISRYGETEFQKTIVKERVTRGISLHTNSVRGLSPIDRLKKTLGEEGGNKAYQQWRKGMAGVFTLEWFKKKYGEELGELRYEERKKNLIDELSRRPIAMTSRNQWSKMSQKLFWEVYRSLVNKNGIYFGELNHEHGCGTNRNFDFVCLPAKKVIEFNGMKFHPKTLSDTNWIQVHTNKSASCIYEDDKRKITAAENKGFVVKVVWEDEYKKNPQLVVEDCITFLDAT